MHYAATHSYMLISGVLLSDNYKIVSSVAILRVILNSISFSALYIEGTIVLACDLKSLPTLELLYVCSHSNHHSSCIYNNSMLFSID